MLHHLVHVPCAHLLTRKHGGLLLLAVASMSLVIAHTTHSFHDRLVPSLRPRSVVRNQHAVPTPPSVAFGAWSTTPHEKSVRAHM